MGPVAYPWWGPWWGWGPVLYSYPLTSVSPPSVNQANIYQGWSAQAVHSADTTAFNTAYRSNGGGVSANSGSSQWQPFQAGTAPLGSSAWIPPSSASSSGSSPNSGNASVPGSVAAPGNETQKAAIHGAPSASSQQAGTAGHAGAGSSGWAPAVPAPAAPAAVAPPHAPVAPPPAPAPPSAASSGGWGPRR